MPGFEDGKPEGAGVGDASDDVVKAQQHVLMGMSEKISPEVIHHDHLLEKRESVDEEGGENPTSPFKETAAVSTEKMTAAASETAPFSATSDDRGKSSDNAESPAKEGSSVPLLQAAVKTADVADTRPLETSSAVFKSTADAAASSRSDSATSTTAASSSEDDKQSALNGRQLKKTCESCARSKVKCDGNLPCTRCSKRGVECVFQYEQKRGRRMGNLGDEPSPFAKRTNLLHGLASRAQPMYPSYIVPAHMVPAMMQQEQLRQMQQHNLQQQMMAAAASQQQHLVNPLGMNRYLQTPVQYMPGYPQETMMGWPPLTGAYGMHQSMPSLIYQPPAFQGYSPNMQLTPARMMPSAVPASLAPVQTPEFIVSPFERRLIRTLMTLVKYHKPTDVKEGSWFQTRLLTLRSLVAGRIKADDEIFLANWLSKHGIQASSSSSAPVPFNAAVQSAEPQLDNLTATLGADQAQQQTPNSQTFGTLKISANGQVDCDQGLMAMIGYTSADFSSQIATLGFLPWGAGLIAFVSIEDQDAYHYILSMAQAIKGAQGEIQDGVLTAKSYPIPVSVNHKHGVRVDCVVSSELVEVVSADSCKTSSASSPTAGGASSGTVTMTFSLAAPERVFVGSSSSKLAPWDVSTTSAASLPFSSSSWLRPILDWVDSAV